jgi:hypothetical protein
LTSPPAFLSAAFRGCRGKAGFLFSGKKRMPAPPPPPTDFTITPPTNTIWAGALSGVFTLTLNAASVAGDAFTLSDGGHGGTFYAGVAVTIAAGQTSSTFSYLQPVAGNVTITATHTTLGAHSVAVIIAAETPGWEVRLYDSTGKRRGLPAGCISELDFEVLERGGYGRGSLRMLATWEEIGLVGGERVDVYIDGALQYRGIVQIPERSVSGSGEEHSPTMYGRMEQLNGYHSSRQYAYGVPKDLADVFSDIVADYIAVSGRLPSVVVDAQAIGVHVQTFDARGKKLRDALNALCDIAPGQCIWGFDTVLSGGVYVDRIYIRPMPTTVGYRLSLRGGEGHSLQYSSDIGSIENRLFIKGGKVAKPNLVKNGSFETPAPNSETVGNLLKDYSAEIGDPAWSLSAGASVKGAGDFGGPRTGTRWWEFDNAGEKLEQTVFIDYLTLYTFTGWARYEDAAHPQVLSVQVDGVNAGGTVLATAVYLTGPNGWFDPGGDTYVRFVLGCNFTAWPTIVAARVRVQAIAASGYSGGSGSNDGVLVDDMAFYETQGVSDPSWIYQLYGGAKRTAMDWEYKGPPTPYHGGYCVKAQANGTVAGTDFMLLRSTYDSRITVRPNNRYSFVVFSYPQSALLTAAFRLVIFEYKSDGTLQQTDVSDLMGWSSLAWKPWRFQVVMNAATVAVELAIRLDNDNIHYFDAVWFGELEEPDELSAATGGYWEVDTYERVIDVTNADLADSTKTGGTVISADAAASITTYGEREAEASNTEIVDYPTALAYAVGHFNAHAVPKVQGPITINNARQIVKPDGLVRIINLPNPPAAAFPSRIRTKIGADGFISQDMDLGTERPELADLLRATEVRAAKGLTVI